MKTFKKLLGEVAQPVSPDEQRFKAQHEIQKFDYPVKDSDAMFKGTISTPAAAGMRPADQADSMNYDKAYSSRKAPTSNVGESAEESAEQIDEISKGLAGRYIKKAQMDTAHAGDQIATGSMGQAGASSAVKKGYENQRKKGISKLIRRRSGTADAVSKLTGTARVPAKEEVEVTEMKKRMGMKKFMEAKELGENEKAALAKEINKSAEASKEGKKKVTLKKAPWEKNEKVNETLKSALKKPVQTTTPDGKTRTVLKSVKNTSTDDHGQDKIKESVEFIDEAVKAGNMKLKDGARIKVANEDAKLINALFKGLNSANKRKMEQVMMTDKKGFNEILGFAKNAM
jgi:hypothetical protein